MLYVPSFMSRTPTSRKWGLKKLSFHALSSRQHVRSNEDHEQNMCLLKQRNDFLNSPLVIENPLRLTKVLSHHTINDRVVINVSGMLFIIHQDTLMKHPYTMLGNVRKCELYYWKDKGEYFFDRHRVAFEGIFIYYQYGGRLRRPADVHDDVFLAELEFFEMEKEMIESYKNNEGYIPEEIKIPCNTLKGKLWVLFEFPNTSFVALCLAVMSVSFTVTSISMYCIETLPMFTQSHCIAGDVPNFKNPFFLTESICTAWFTIEFVARALSCPSTSGFFRDIKNYIDCVSVIPFYITAIMIFSSQSCEQLKNSASLAVLRVVRLVRIFKLTKHSNGLQVLLQTFRASAEGLSLFLVALAVCVVFFSSLIYYAESGDYGNGGSKVESIPDAFWWAVITMCTVGYGDKVPQSIWGRVVGSMCAVAGVLTLAIPVPIITENFNRFYRAQRISKCRSLC